jgi:hypothetical protein
MSVPLFRARALALAVAVVGLAGAAPAARADSTALPATGCGDQQLEQPFLPWGDPSNYTLVPGGSFEAGGPAWSTTGDAGLVADNEPWGSGVQAMSLPPGSTTTSPATCIDPETPTLRFFAESSDDSPDSSLQVEVLFTSPYGFPESLPVGTVAANGAWEPTPPYSVGISGMSGVDSSYDTAQFEFIPQGSASWEIDDVYVDPWSKG